MNRWWTIPICALALSCNYDPEVVDSRSNEGDDPGECEDGADNDLDGYFDCQDNECWFSPACAEESDADTDSDSDSDTDSDTDTDTDTDIGGGTCGTYLDTMDLSYTLVWDINDPTNSLPLLGLDLYSCTMVFSGTGTLDTAVGTRATFAGTYDLVSSDCPATLADAIYTPSTSASNHTFHWNGDCTVVEEWAVHKGASNYSAGSGADYYINEMTQAWQPGTSVDIDFFIREYAALGLEPAGATSHTEHTLDVTFTK